MKEHWFPILLFVIIAVVIARSFHADQKETASVDPVKVLADTLWHGPHKDEIPTLTEAGKMIMYGHELIANTSYYLGPKGKVARITNGMNCQNCHLDGGTVPFANNYGKVYSTYPQFRARSNGIQTIYGRINDCLERSLNGKKMDSTSEEMKAIYAYMQWLGNDVPKGMAKGGTSIMKLKYLERAADPVAGKQVYISQCQSCHGNNGQGQPKQDASGYIYPPLWGENSFNDGAGLHRLSSFAGFVKNNMPFGASYHAPTLNDEEAWDVAAFVISQPRPHKNQAADWKDLSKKPIDFPFGPYDDPFDERQHKYGPYQPILASRTAKNPQ